jgi:hypothetical protein
MHRSIIATWGVVALVAIGSIAAAQTPAPKPRATPRATPAPLAFTARGHAEISFSMGDREVSGTAEFGMSQRANLTRFDVISVHSDALPLPPINVTVVIDRTARIATVWSNVTKHFYVQRFTVNPGPGPTPTPSPFPLFVGRSPFANLDVLDMRMRLTGHGTTAGIATTALEFEAHFANKGSTKIAHVTATTQLADDYGGFPMAIELAFDSSGSAQTAKMSYGVDSLTRALPNVAGFRIPAGYTRASSALAVVLNGFSTGNGGSYFPVIHPTIAPAAASPAPSSTTSPAPAPSASP